MYNSVLFFARIPGWFLQLPWRFVLPSLETAENCTSLQRSTHVFYTTYSLVTSVSVAYSCSLLQFLNTWGGEPHFLHVLYGNFLIKTTAVDQEKGCSVAIKRQKSGK